MTSPYRKVLVAIDCSDESAEVLSRAAGVQEGTDGELHLIHVIEPLALAYGADVPMDVTDLQSGLVKQARDTALEYAGHYRIPESRIHVELGSIEKTILDKADDIGADLIVVGSHTRSGLALLLGSTARGLVPGAHCDVLAVKMDKRKKES
ncbi:MAG: universal stress protein [Alcanivorax sp.]|jgi:universal stress protein A|uniref:Universal stress protein n=1 Tax=Alloalcanivorax venustensis ISO4 TaxID=1177184 RepID=A0ABS0AII0_9GAMM|nr:universal stress protein [Alloalcanivorax venustensis]KXJ49022.1 MAG: universal stress protein UspA [Alcanivorax sp. Nap_24]MAK21186.1 universal stress protein UspA [Alcanivorax sp.]MCH9782982.1 universal stress protein [Gammaproteobacteria bacterium]MEA3260194.1 universal stress protein [Pseudomonadota bacterium]SMO78546.1 universal stress protein A [Alcanivorax sp. DSM 26295]|tara:strand:- start:22318 stop:22770 length:453 start_codon:yes stop_codon:yes gene_type:complete